MRKLSDAQDADSYELRRPNESKFKTRMLAQGTLLLVTSMLLTSLLLVYRWREALANYVVLEQDQDVASRMGVCPMGTQSNGYLSFDGERDHLLHQFDKAAFAHGMSVSLWVRRFRIIGHAEPHCLVSQDDGHEHPCLSVCYTEDSRLVVTTCVLGDPNGDVKDYDSVASMHVYPDFGEWHHWAVTLGPPSTSLAGGGGWSITLYRDGLEVGHGSVQKGSGAGRGALLVGGQSHGQRNGTMESVMKGMWRGDLDELVVYGAPISFATVARLFRAGKPAGLWSWQQQEDGVLTYLSFGYWDIAHRPSPAMVVDARAALTPASTWPQFSMVGPPRWSSHRPICLASGPLVRTTTTVNASPSSRPIQAALAIGPLFAGAASAVARLIAQQPLSPSQQPHFANATRTLLSAASSSSSSSSSSPLSSRSVTSQSLSSLGLGTAIPSLTALPPLKIYVYDLPSKWAEQQLSGDQVNPCDATWFDPLSIMAQYSVDVLLARQMRTSAVRTQDPSEADFFFIPALLSQSIFSQCRMTTVQPFLVEDVLSFVRTNWPHWDKKQGTDHVLVYDTHPLPSPSWQGDTLSPKGVYLSQPPILLYLESSIGNTTASPHSWMLDAWPFHPSADEQFLIDTQNIVIPYPVYDKEVHAPLFDLSSVLYKDRSIKYYFAGDPERLGRRALIMQIEAYDPHSVKIVSIDATQRWSHMSMLAEHMKTLQDSQLCLMPANDLTTSKRFYDAVFNLCVPLVLVDNMVFPFPSLINFEEGVIRIPASAVELLQVDLYLRDITPELLASKRQYLSRIRKALLFTVEKQAVPGDAFHSILWELYRVKEYNRKHERAVASAFASVNTDAWSAVQRGVRPCLGLMGGHIPQYEKMLQSLPDALRGMAVASGKLAGKKTAPSGISFTAVRQHMAARLRNAPVPLSLFIRHGVERRLAPDVFDWGRALDHFDSQLWLFVGSYHMYLACISALQTSGDATMTVLEIKEGKGYGAIFTATEFQPKTSLLSLAGTRSKLHVLYLHYYWTSFNPQLPDTWLPHNRQLASFFLNPKQLPYSLTPDHVFVSLDHHATFGITVATGGSSSDSLRSLILTATSAWPQCNFYWTTVPCPNEEFQRVVQPVMVPSVVVTGSTVRSFNVQLKGVLNQLKADYFDLFALTELQQGLTLDGLVYPAQVYLIPLYTRLYSKMLGSKTPLHLCVYE